jgi:hypothetical protein
MTEGNTELHLHNESVDDIISVLRANQVIPSQERLDTIANTIEAQCLDQRQ